MVLMMPKDENEGQHLVYTAMQYEDGPIALRYARGNGLGVHMDEELKAIQSVRGDVKRGYTSSYFNVWYDNTNGNGSS